MARMIAVTKTGIGCKATKIYDDNGHFAVQLYATVVYDETAEFVTLNTGGWHTQTTKQRINSALVYRGFQPGCSIKAGVMSYRGIPLVKGPVQFAKSEMRRLSEVA